MNPCGRAYVIGLTGQSGAGKTTVCGVFRREGFDVIDADLISREVTRKGEPCLNELAEAFGSGILLPDGSLDRAASSFLTASGCVSWTASAIHTSFSG